MSWGSQGDGTFHVPRLHLPDPPRRELIASYRLRLVRDGTYPYDGPNRSDCPVAAALFLHEVLDGFDREILGALFLDVRRRAIGHTEAYVGSLSGINAEPRGIFVPALLANAAYVVLYHTHPSGDPSPSPADQVFTAQVAAVGEALKIPLLDHLILGEPPRFVSLRDLGWLP